MENISTTRKPQLNTSLLIKGEPTLVELVKEIDKMHGMAVCIQDEKGRINPVRINTDTLQVEVFRGGKWQNASNTTQSETDAKSGFFITSEFGNLIKAALVVDNTLKVTGIVTIDNLTASRLTASSAAKGLVSTNLDSWVTGTTNRLTVAADGNGGVTLSTPQDTHSTATPTFGGMTLNGNLALGANTLTTSNATVVTNLNADTVDGNHMADITKRSWIFG